jgi:hypothetical protein
MFCLERGPPKYHLIDPHKLSFDPLAQNPACTPTLTYG